MTSAISLAVDFFGIAATVLFIAHTLIELRKTRASGDAARFELPVGRIMLLGKSRISR